MNFYSQLVAEAYKKANIDFFRETLLTTKLGDIPILALVDDLRYLAHLKNLN